MPVSNIHTGWRRDKANSRLDFYYQGTRVGHINTSGLSLTSGAITNDLVQAAGLGTSLRTGFIDLPLTSWRIADAAGTNYGLLAATAAIGSGGVGGIDASPGISRVNAGTDKTARIVYADAVVKPILNDFTLPPDCDESAALTFKVLAAMSGTNNNTSILTLTWVAVAAGGYVAGSDQGSATSAFGATATDLVTKSIAIAADDVNAPGSHVSVSLTPTSPGTDAMHIYGTWVEYQRKT